MALEGAVVTLIYRHLLNGAPMVQFAYVRDEQSSRFWFSFAAEAAETCGKSYNRSVTPAQAAGFHMRWGDGKGVHVHRGTAEHGVPPVDPTEEDA